jgi:polysaccharide biosynthesis/export protein
MLATIVEGLLLWMTGFSGCDGNEQGEQGPQQLLRGIPLGVGIFFMTFPRYIWAASMQRNDDAGVLRQTGEFELNHKAVVMIIGMRALLIMGLAAVMTTTALGQSIPPVMNPTRDSSYEKSSLIVTTDYIIGPEDVLDITVWKNLDLSKTVQVRPDGRISLPLIGDVAAVSRTSAQLTEEISTRLKSYMENPTVSIVVKEVNSYAIFVLGEVAKPGRYPLKSKTTLLQAITLASGLTPVASRNKIVIFRFAKDGEPLMKIKASYDDIVLRDGTGQNIELKPGDTIVVPSESMVVIPGQ